MTVSCGYFKAQAETGLTAYHLDLAFAVSRGDCDYLGSAGVAIIVAGVDRAGCGCRNTPPRRRVGGVVVDRRRAVDRDRFARIVRHADVPDIVADRGREVPALVI